MLVKTGDEARDSTSPKVNTSQSANAASPKEATWYSWYVLAMLVLIYMFSQLDRKLPIILVESIKHDLNLSDTEIGLATGVMFTLVYSVFGIPISRFADRYGRKSVICLSLLTWSAITGLNGLATSFWQFAVARSGVAVGEAGATPSALSLLPDFFPARTLALAGGLFMTAAPIGYFIALAGGGLLNDLASWRTAMMVMAVPGLILALLASLTIREPSRLHPSLQEPLPSLRRALLELWRIETYRHMNIGAMASGCAVGALGSFTPAYIMRTFGLSTAHTGWSYGILALLAGVSAAILGGAITDQLRDRDVRAGLWYFSLISLIALPASVAALFTTSYFTFLALMAFPEATITGWSGPSTAVIMALVDKRAHALASSVYLFSFMGIGFSIGPVLAGGISDLLHPIFHHDSLKWALVLIAFIRLFAVFHYFIAASKLKRELVNVAAL